MPYLRLRSCTRVAFAGVTTWAPSKAISFSAASMRPVAVAASEPSAVPCISNTTSAKQQREHGRLVAMG